jgi:flagellar hook-associated protein 3 FlgL
VTGDMLLGDTTSGAFKVLIDLKNALVAGDTATTRAQLDLLKANSDNMVNQQANIGSTLNQLNLTQERTQSKQDVASQLYSQLQDVDMPQLITNLRFQEQINEASLGVMGRILPKSIFNFLS